MIVSRWILLNMKNMWDKSERLVDLKKKHFTFNNYFSRKLCRLWDNMVQLEIPQIYTLLSPCRMLFFHLGPWTNSITPERILVKIHVGNFKYNLLTYCNLRQNCTPVTLTWHEDPGVFLRMCQILLAKYFLLRRMRERNLQSTKCPLFTSSGFPGCCQAAVIVARTV
jgi:hypothetical protein